MEKSGIAVETFTEEEKAKVNAQVKETVRQINKMFLDKKFDSVSYLVEYLSHPVDSPKRNGVDSLLREQKNILQKCINPLVDIYYNNFNDSLHILNEIYEDFSGTQERIDNLKDYTSKINDILATKKEGLQELYMKKFQLEYLLEILKRVDLIKGANNHIEECLNNKKYIAAADHVVEIESLLQTSPFDQFNAFAGIKKALEEKKRALEASLLDKLTRLIHFDDEDLYSNYNYTTYNGELTAETESMLITKGEFTCDIFTVINIYVTALTRLGYCYEVESRLKTSLYGKLTSIYTAYVKQLTKDEEKARDVQLMKETLLFVMKRFEQIAWRHFHTIDSLNRCINEQVSTTPNQIDPEYTYTYVSLTVQKSLQGLLSKFIQPMSAVTPSQTASRAMSKKDASVRLTYRFSDSTAWMNTIVTKEDMMSMKKVTSIYTDVCECSLTNVIYVYKDVYEFYSRLQNKIDECIINHPENKTLNDITKDNNNDTINLFNYISNFIKNELLSHYKSSMQRVIQGICNGPQAFIEKDSDKILYLAHDFVDKFKFLSKEFLSLNEDYIYLIPSMSFYFNGYINKITQFIKDTFKGSYVEKRFDWMGKEGIELWRSDILYEQVEKEIPLLYKEYETLSLRRRREKEMTLEGDLFNICVDPAIRQEDLVSNDVIYKCVSMCNSVFWSVQQIATILDTQQIEPGFTILPTQTEFKTTILPYLEQVKQLYIQLLFYLRLELRTRVFFHIQRVRYDDITVCASHLSESAPPLFMYNLYNDVTTLANIYQKNFSVPKFTYLSSAVLDFLPLLLIKTVSRLPITEITPAVILSYKQSLVTVQQTLRAFVTPAESIALTKQFSDYISLLSMSKKEIEEYITNNPNEFSPIDYKDLFRLDAPNREEDMAAIDWITDIINEQRMKKKENKKRNVL
ncbi:hypothetical protein WA158_005363 [Blastocystis sp. Blastoise]